MKNILVWIPVIGVLFMIIYCKYGRFSTLNYAGILSQPFQLICFLTYQGRVCNA